MMAEGDASSTNGSLRGLTEWVGRDGVVREATVPIPSREAAIQYILDKLMDPDNGLLDSLDEVAAVGFKTVYANGITGCQYLDDHVQRRADHHYRLWTLLMLELWHRTFLDAPCPSRAPAS